MVWVKVSLTCGQGYGASCGRRIKSNALTMEVSVRLICLQASRQSIEGKGRHLKGSQASASKQSRHKQRVTDKHHIAVLSVGVFTQILIKEWKRLAINVLSDSRGKANAAIKFKEEDAQLTLFNGHNVLLVVRENELHQVRATKVRRIIGDVIIVIDMLQGGSFFDTAIYLYQYVRKTLRRCSVDSTVSPHDRRIANLTKLEAVDWDTNFLHQLRL